MHIPDKPGQSHNTQDFESTLSEVRFLCYTVPGCSEVWGTQRDSVKLTYWDERGLDIEVITKFMYQAHVGGKICSEVQSSLQPINITFLLGF